MGFRAPRREEALELYARAREYSQTIDKDRDQIADKCGAICESDFLAEAAWVILCSGFRESVVRAKFSYISLCFCDWESASAIVDSGAACISAASKAINHEAKLLAILNIARLLHFRSFESFRAELIEDPINTLQSLPYIGQITALHLAKNLGFNVSKPDRHLVRVSDKLGFGDTSALCGWLEAVTGARERTVDLLIWRYLADNPKQRLHWI